MCSGCANFRQFCRQFFYASLAAIFSSLKPGMTQPEVIKFPDGHFRRLIWGIGPYIADYPEQVLLTCIVQGWCAWYIFFPPIHSILWHLRLQRCQALPDQLNNSKDTSEWRSRNHTDFLATKCKMEVLYDNYGIIGDIIVVLWFIKLHSICSDLIFLAFHKQISTSWHTRTYCTWSAPSDCERNFQGSLSKLGQRASSNPQQQQSKGQ